MSISGFEAILRGPFTSYLSLSQQISEDVAVQSTLVEKAFQAQLEYLMLANQLKASTQAEQSTFLKPIGDCIINVRSFRDNNLNSRSFHHLSTISEGILALGWVTVTPAPAAFVKKMSDSCQYFVNRILKKYKTKDKKHVHWVRGWLQTLSDLEHYVEHTHPNGLIWACCSAPSPLPISRLQPTPILEDVTNKPLYCNNNFALFASINNSESTSQKFKNVTASEKSMSRNFTPYTNINLGENTNQNYKSTGVDTNIVGRRPVLKNNPFPARVPQPASNGVPFKVPRTTNEPPVFIRIDKDWIIEHQNRSNLIVRDTEENDVVNIVNCVRSSIVVNGKVSTITLDSCFETVIVFDSVVSAIKFINCNSVQMQVFGKVPKIVIDQTLGCQMYLNDESIDVEVFNVRSSGLNILIPKSHGIYVEYPIPEQYRSVVTPSGLRTSIVEDKD